MKKSKVKNGSGSQVPNSTTIDKIQIEYEKPRILFREKLEAVAAVCDGVGGKAVVPEDCELFAGS